MPLFLSLSCLIPTSPDPHLTPPHPTPSAFFPHLLRIVKDESSRVPSSSSAVTNAGRGAPTSVSSAVQLCAERAAQEAGSGFAEQPPFESESQLASRGRVRGRGRNRGRPPRVDVPGTSATPDANNANNANANASSGEVASDTHSVLPGMSAASDGCSAVSAAELWGKPREAAPPPVGGPMVADNIAAAAKADDFAIAADGTVMRFFKVRGCQQKVGLLQMPSVGCTP